MTNMPISCYSTRNRRKTRTKGFTLGTRSRLRAPMRVAGISYEYPLCLFFVIPQRIGEEKEPRVSPLEPVPDSALEMRVAEILFA